MQGLLKSGMSAENGARPPEPPKAPQANQGSPVSGRPPRQPGTSQQQAQGRPEKRPQGNGVDMDPERAMQQRNVLVNSMLSSLYGPMLDDAGAILERTADSPSEGIGRIVGSLLSASYQSLREKGRTVTPGVMVQAGMVAAQAVGEMATRMGVLSAEAEPEIVESAFMLGMGRFGEQNADTLKPEQRKRYSELIDSMEQGKRMAMDRGYNARGNREKMMQGGA